MSSINYVKARYPVLVLLWLLGTGYFFRLSAQPVVLSSSLIRIVEDAGNKEEFSGTVLVAKEDSIVMIKSAGYADKEEKVRNGTNTKFNIASTGKLFTRIVILQLIQEGKLSLDDTIGRFFTGFDQEYASRISIFHLLDHRSGLGDVYVTKKYANPENYTSEENVVKLIAQEKPEFIPGTKDKYSNSGYYLLGAIISKVTGKSFAEAVTERIFKPLTMINSGFAKTGDIVQGHAAPYKKNGKRSVIALIGEPPTGAGSEYSTVTDLYRVFYSMMSDNTLLSDASKASLFNRFQPGSWEEIKRSGKITGYLGGDTRGWSAKLTFMFYNTGAYTTVILANYDDMAHKLDLKLRELIKK